MSISVKTRQLSVGYEDGLIKLEAILENAPTLAGREEVVWTVQGVDNSSQITHGGGASEGVFLGYDNNTNPVIDVMLPLLEPYNLIVKARVLISQEDTVRVEVNPDTGETRDVIVENFTTTEYVGNVINVTSNSSWV